MKINKFIKCLFPVFICVLLCSCGEQDIVSPTGTEEDTAIASVTESDTSEATTDTTTPELPELPEYVPLSELPEEYGPELAAEDGCYVPLIANSNSLLLLRFYTMIQNGEEGTLRIYRPSMDSPGSLLDVTTKGDGNFVFVEDHSRDWFWFEAQTTTTMERNFTYAQFIRFGGRIDLILSDFSNPNYLISNINELDLPCGGRMPYYPLTFITNSAGEFDEYLTPDSGGSYQFSKQLTDGRIIAFDSDSRDFSLGDKTYDPGEQVDRLILAFEADEKLLLVGKKDGQFTSCLWIPDSEEFIWLTQDEMYDALF